MASACVTRSLELIASVTRLLVNHPEQVSVEADGQGAVLKVAPEDSPLLDDRMLRALSTVLSACEKDANYKVKMAR